MWRQRFQWERARFLEVGDAEWTGPEALLFMLRVQEIQAGELQKLARRALQLVKQTPEEP
jgi:hypothetical protein